MEVTLTEVKSLDEHTVIKTKQKKIKKMFKSGQRRSLRHAGAISEVNQTTVSQFVFENLKPLSYRLHLGQQLS